MNHKHTLLPWSRFQMFIYPCVTCLKFLTMTWSKHGPNHDDSSHIIVQIWPHPNIPAHIASSTILKQYNYNIIIFYIQSLTSFQEVGGFNTITLLNLILESLRKWNQAIKYLHIIIIIFDKIGRNILP